MGFGIQSTHSPAALSGVQWAGGKRGNPTSITAVPVVFQHLLPWIPRPRGQWRHSQQTTEHLQHLCTKNHGEAHSSNGEPETKPQPGDTSAQDHGCHPGTPQHHSLAAPSHQRFIFHHLWQQQARCALPSPPAPINMHQAGFMETDGMGG